MWRYNCPICGERITENKNREGVKALMRLSHTCPSCGGKLYIDDTGTPIDLGKMLARALELSTNVVIPKELAIAHYYE